jgi:A/G-specific adenine glycosylase
LFPVKKVSLPQREKAKKTKHFKHSSVHAFRKAIYHHYEEQGRTFPWRKTRNPYYILVSEVMLQQTQVDRVTEKYLQFIKVFPDVSTLARAPLKTILKVWQGLGYNRRALALKKIAQIVAKQYNSKIPRSLDELVEFPGIGQATASEILAFAFNQPTVFIETNIRSVFIHFFFPDREDVSDDEILPLVEKTLDCSNPRKWYYALMDYGVTLKKRYTNPSRKSAHYNKQSPFNGSNRQVRGKILRFLTAKSYSSAGELSQQLNLPLGKVRSNLITLEQEGFIRRSGQRLTIA